MFVLAADDVSKKELSQISRKIEKQLEKWAQKDTPNIPAASNTEAVTDMDTVPCIATGPSCKTASRTTEVCELVMDVDQKGSCTFSVVSKVESDMVNDVKSPTTGYLTNGYHTVFGGDSSVLTHTNSNLTELKLDPNESYEKTEIIACTKDSSSVVPFVDVDNCGSVRPGCVSTNAVLSIASPHKSEVGNSAGLAKLPDPSQYVALDCEFVGVRNDQSALGRCSIVDFYGNIVCDIYAQPNEPITTYRTRWSGITRCHMRKAIPVESALSQISDKLQGKIVVGHALFNDFAVMGISHPQDKIRDTSLYLPLRHLLHEEQPVSLKRLAKDLLGKQIQKGNHCSVIDAQTTMDIFNIVRLQWEQSILEGNPPEDPPPSRNGSAKKRKRSEISRTNNCNRVPACSNKNQKTNMGFSNTSSKNGKIHFGQINTQNKSVHTYFSDNSNMKVHCNFTESVITQRVLCDTVGGESASGSKDSQCGTSTDRDMQVKQDRTTSAGSHSRRRRDSFCEDVDLANCGTGKSLFKDEFWPNLKFF